MQSCLPIWPSSVASCSGQRLRICNDRAKQRPPLRLSLSRSLCESQIVTTEPSHERDVRLTPSSMVTMARDAAARLQPNERLLLISQRARRTRKLSASAERLVFSRSSPAGVAANALVVGAANASPRLEVAPGRVGQEKVNICPSPPSSKLAHKTTQSAGSLTPTARQRATSLGNQKQSETNIMRRGV